MKLLLERGLSNNINTAGKLTVINDDGSTAFICCTLELAWLDNIPNKSCIPIGSYTVSRYTSLRLGPCFIVNNVEDRSYILIHAGNYASSDVDEKTDTEGCILVGMGYMDLNGDGVIDIADSRQALQHLLELINGTIEFEIMDA